MYHTHFLNCANFSDGFASQSLASLNFAVWLAGVMLRDATPARHTAKIAVKLLADAEL